MPTKDDIAYCLLLSHTVNNENLYFLYETEHVYFFFELVNLNVFTLVGFVNFNIIMASIFPAGLRNGVKGLDANRYATKKTVAQGMLDIALLTSNASQLKYVLQVGPKHEFYMLLLVLISISIILQASAGILALVISAMDGESSNKQKKIADWLYHISVGLMTGVVFCDVIKMTFGLDPALSMQDSFGNGSLTIHNPLLNNFKN
ncbi:ninjurin-1 isoform X2 [Maniola jurtina]|uniref:ninjurin-1 isoform X2 n=1 Tax=Maniola jurtina TaxID=191418 RepID=UPI001E68896D|nr:ninjurin-1 isoform X2 [Maniola jurtina]